MFENSEKEDEKSVFLQQGKKTDLLILQARPEPLHQFFMKLSYNRPVFIQTEANLLFIHMV